MKQNTLFDSRFSFFIFNVLSALRWYFHSKTDPYIPSRLSRAIKLGFIGIVCPPQPVNRKICFHFSSNQTFLSVIGFARYLKQSNFISPI